MKIINEIWLDEDLDEDYAAPGFILQADWTVVDLGANKGFFASWALKKAPAAQLHCFEPDPRNFAALRENTRHFGKAATVHQVAVGSVAGSLTLFRLAGRAGQASVFRSRAESSGEIIAEVAVEVKPLTDILADLGDIDLLKVDVEGAEYDILLDSPPEALARVKHIIVEADEFDPANRQRRIGDFTEQLRNRGFTFSMRRRTLTFFARPGW